MFASAAITARPVSSREAQELVRQENLQIAQGLKRQDAGLLDALIVRYQHRLLRYLLYLTSNREQAEDLFQEVWMRVLLRGGQFNGEARFDTWLFESAPCRAWMRCSRRMGKTTGQRGLKLRRRVLHRSINVRMEKTETA